MAEEERILDEEHVHEELAVKYETGDEDGAEKIIMLPADVNVGTRRKVPLKERLSLTLHLLKLLSFYLLRPSLLISLSYFGLMLIPLITLHALSYNKHHLLEGCYILSFINISGVSILVSMIVACNYKMLKHRLASSNIILQKTFIIWFLYCMMLTGLWMNCSLIFKFAVRNDQEFVNVAK